MTFYHDVRHRIRFQHGNESVHDGDCLRLKTVISGIEEYYKGTDAGGCGMRTEKQDN